MGASLADKIVVVGHAGFFAIGFLYRKGVIYTAFYFLASTACGDKLKVNSVAEAGSTYPLNGARA